MTEAQFSILVLGVVLVASNAFWAWHSHLLLNKLMSRNYQEFKVADVTTDKPKNNTKMSFAVDDMAGMSEFN